MHHDYNDIISRISIPPLWWDEYAVPRFDDFKPGRNACIYADEIVFLHIQCQGCGHDFRVCMSSSKMSRLNLAKCTDGEIVYRPSMAEAVAHGDIHYGDPPNYCCAAGSTMNSIPRRVLEFWERGVGLDWERRHDLEVDIDPDWAKV